MVDVSIILSAAGESYELSDRTIENWQELRVSYRRSKKYGGVFRTITNELVLVGAARAWFLTRWDAGTRDIVMTISIAGDLLFAGTADRLTYRNSRLRLSIAFDALDDPVLYIDRKSQEIARVNVTDRPYITVYPAESTERVLRTRALAAAAAGVPVVPQAEPLDKLTGSARLKIFPSSVRGFDVVDGATRIIGGAVPVGVERLDFASGLLEVTIREVVSVTGRYNTTSVGGHRPVREWLVDTLRLADDRHISMSVFFGEISYSSLAELVGSDNIDDSDVSGPVPPFEQPPSSWFFSVDMIVEWRGYIDNVSGDIDVDRYIEVLYSRALADWQAQFSIDAALDGGAVVTVPLSPKSSQMTISSRYAYAGVIDIGYYVQNRLYATPVGAFDAAIGIATQIPLYLFNYANIYERDTDAYLRIGDYLDDLLNVYCLGVRGLTDGVTISLRSYVDLFADVDSGIELIGTDYEEKYSPLFEENYLQCGDRETKSDYPPGQVEEYNEEKNYQLYAPASVNATKVITLKHPTGSHLLSGFIAGFIDNVDQIIGVSDVGRNTERVSFDQTDANLLYDGGSLRLPSPDSLLGDTIDTYSGVSDKYLDRNISAAPLRNIAFSAIAQLRAWAWWIKTVVDGGDYLFIGGKKNNDLRINGHSIDRPFELGDVTTPVTSRQVTATVLLYPPLIKQIMDAPDQWLTLSIDGEQITGYVMEVQIPVYKPEASEITIIKKNKP